MTTLTSREFNQRASEAKKAAAHGPVFITDRGEPKHVLMSIEDYLRLTGGKSIVDLIGMAKGSEIDFEPPRAEGLSRLPDFS